jgi:hypothetical protein
MGGYCRFFERGGGTVDVSYRYIRGLAKREKRVQL